jgi:uncharacterized protein (DUF362 family)/Pyruvate/2-oxoacid:ferredoxin oxidoreductase delta subunit
MKGRGIMGFEVSIVKCASYEREEVIRAVQACLAPLGGIRAFVKPGDRVLVKPNLLSAKPPENAVTTHPSVVYAAVTRVQECGATAIVGDSPGGRNTGRSYRRLLEKTEISAVIEETGAESVFFDNDVIKVTSENARTFKKFTVPKIVRDVDAIIALPKLKTHVLTGMTGAVKLTYGYLPGVTKAEYHFSCGKDPGRFAELLADLHGTFPPALSLMDAIVAMEGNGPQSGLPREVGLLMAGRSAPALDFAAATIMGFDPLAVLPLRNLAERGTGPGSLDEICVFGENISSVSIPDIRHPASTTFLGLPPVLLRLGETFLSSRPGIRQAACSRCGTCAEQCPAHAIEWEKGAYPRIRHRSCIRCFCCQELCPQGAISVQTPLIRRMIS